MTKGERGRELDERSLSPTGAWFMCVYVFVCMCVCVCPEGVSSKYFPLRSYCVCARACAYVCVCVCLCVCVGVWVC